MSLQEVVFTPYVGQTFKSDEEAFEYCSNFARKNGFSIRKVRSTESLSFGVYRRDFVCYSSQFNRPKKKANVENPRDRKSLRFGSDAKLYLTKEIVDGGPQWFVSQFSDVYNHELWDDDQVHLLPACRKIEEADQKHIILLSKAGFPVNRIAKVLELGKGIQPGLLLLQNLVVGKEKNSCICQQEPASLWRSMHKLFLRPFAFSALQNDIVLSMQYAITEMVNSSYLLRHYKKIEGESLVIWIPDDEHVHCSCKEFEHSGILCRHSLQVLLVKNHFEIKYWTDSRLSLMS